MSIVQKYVEWLNESRDAENFHKLASDAHVDDPSHKDWDAETAEQFTGRSSQYLEKDQKFKDGSSLKAGLHIRDPDNKEKHHIPKNIIDRAIRSRRPVSYDGESGPLTIQHHSDLNDNRGRLVISHEGRRWQHGHNL